ncbi:MAG: single-stranded DNA-binding protein [Candidatus Levybacteria bacterium]|nr:single-stranded DNA-binding protein [Candidatus Levybacteria bacterium]
MARSLNRVQLIGNLTRDPELRYTPNGTAVCSFGIATNRSWTTETGEKRDEAEFHRIVSWNKLAELCSQFLTKGKKVFVEGRLSTRNWNAQDGTQKTTTEIIISDMILLDSSGRRTEVSEVQEEASEQKKPATSNVADATTEALKKTETQSKVGAKKEVKDKAQDSPTDEEVAPDDIPF